MSNENYIYARQSLDIRDSLSVETQVEKGKSLLEPGENYRLFIDKGFSGKNTKRPELQRMLKEIENGTAGKVIVYRLDRFSRSILDFAEMWAVLEKHHVEFVSVNEHFDTSTPIGKAMVFIIMIFAQMERETIAERVTDNFYDRVKTGRWPGGPAPWGCSLGKLRLGDADIPTLTYNDNMDIMEENYYRYFEETDLSLGRLAKELTERGIAGPKGLCWNNVTLARLLRNPAWVLADADIYAYFSERKVVITNELEEFQGVNGCVLVGKRDANTRQRNDYSQMQLSLANWPGRIPSKVWLGVQQRLSGNRQVGNAGKGKYTWLTGLLKCGRCGRALTVGGEKKQYLYCSGAHSNSGICTQRGKFPLNVSELEGYVADELKEVLEKCENQPIEVSESLISNEDKLRRLRLEKQIRNLMERLAQEDVTPLTITYINEELARLHEEHQAISNQAEIRTKRLNGHINIRFEELAPEEKKLVAQSYIGKIFLSRQQMEIFWLV